MESTFVILFAIASLVAIMARRARVPYTVALVVVGLIVGAFHVVEAPRLTKELLFAVFLPGLVFEAAYNIHVSELRATWRTIATLAVPGVVLAIGLTAALATAAFGLVSPALAFTWRDALVLAALLAATDPIAVVSLFRDMGMPPRLTTMIEAESLFNDGTSIVVLSLVLAFVTGTSTSIVGLTGEFLLVVGGGAVTGLLMGFALARLTKELDEPMVEITLTTIAAYGSFVVAERLHLSGVIATVSAGLVLGTYGREIAMSEATRVSVDAFWEYVAFALNSVVFLLIGFELRPSGLVGEAVPIIVAFLALITVRLIVISATMVVFRGTSERFSRARSLILTWGGLRGALSMVLALALPAEFPKRGLLIDLTVGVVLMSLLLQGLTMKALVRRVGHGEEASGDVASPH
ncbi:MAG: cation:proton antiporter [Gemmatimonadaceae bacterium]|nr:cation:proton antiporter [Gemmatimonadaceae bacterium]